MVLDGLVTFQNNGLVGNSVLVGHQEAPEGRRHALLLPDDLTVEKELENE